MTGDENIALLDVFYEKDTNINPPVYRLQRPSSDKGMSWVFRLHNWMFFNGRPSWPRQYESWQYWVQNEDKEKQWNTTQKTKQKEQHESHKKCV